jgi:hypothetical protein
MPIAPPNIGDSPCARLFTSATASPRPLLAAVFGGVPYTMLHGVPTDLAHLKIFGCTAYLRLEDRYRDKLSPKALRCMFTGYCDDGPGY